ncbi:MAG: protein kinase [Lachnospiraceae bacterium]|nr:protein kinase [Lachnospiraceae bacterium]
MSDNQQEAWDKYPAALARDTILAGRYIIKEVLGQGGFGITYLAEDHKKRTNVAVKEFFPEGMVMRQNAAPEVRTYTDERLENFRFGMQTFLEEAKVLAQFRGNLNIVNVQGYFEENGTAYFVMDYIEGIDFKTYLKEHGGSLGWEETWRIMEPVMNALYIAHQKGIIHRDVAPDNIFITRDNTVKLIDFGAARYSLGERSQSLDVILKPGYTPKEQYVRRGRQGPYTDVYSVAACFYAALSGYLPPESLERMEEDNLVPLSTRGVKLPQTAEDAILKGLEVRAEDRFQSMDEFRRAITGETLAAEQTPVPQMQVSTSVSQQSAPAPKKRKRIVAAGCAAAVVLLLMMISSGSNKTAKDGGNSSAWNETQSGVKNMEDTAYQKTASIEDTGSGNEGEDSKQWQIDVVNAYLDIYCRDDPTTYTNLGLGTADEAHALHENFRSYILTAMLSENLYDNYDIFCSDYLDEALAKAEYTVTDIEEKSDGSFAVTISYRQLKYFEGVENRYKQYVNAKVQDWFAHPEIIPPIPNNMAYFVLSELFDSMIDTVESAEYGQETSEVFDLEYLEGFVCSGLLDMDILVPYAEKQDNQLTVRGYDNMHNLSVWDDSAYFGGFDDNGDISGEGIYVWSDGRIYAGGWKAGKCNGYGVYIADGRTFKGIWEDNKIIEQ